MAEDFGFNAPQFVDFSSDLKETEIENVEAYFDVDHENDIGQKPVSELQPSSVLETEPPTLENKLRRRSMSVGNIFAATHVEKDDLSEAINNLNLEEKCDDKEVPQRSRTTNRGVSINVNRARSASRDKRPKPESYHSVAETVKNFEKGFRAEQTFKPFRIHSTIPQSPALKTKQRARPKELTSQEEEKKQIEDLKKYKIRAKPVNAKILYGPVKPPVPVERKHHTVVEPFKLTATVAQAKPTPQENETYQFQAKPIPKTTYNPYNRLQKQRSLDNLNRRSTVSLNNTPQRQPTNTEALPLSFEERNKQLQKRKEEFINKVLEEEKKAREFHARPLPKYLQQASQANDTTLIKKNANQENVQVTLPTFKARPATVLYKKPFEPKLGPKPLTEITEFQLNTDKRAKEREAFEEDMKKREERIEQFKKQEEEKRLVEEEKQIALLRKQAEYRANPVRHYKEIVIKKSNKITIPLSPRFAVEERIKNKENAHQGM